MLCLAAALGAIVSNEFASGAAVVNGSEGFATVKMGLWHGSSLSAGRQQVVHYEWCLENSPSYHFAHCAYLQTARVSACVGVGVLVALLVLLALLTTFGVRARLEPKLARVAGGIAGFAALCFALCLAVWAVLVLDLSSGKGGGKAQLSIGISWLAEGGAFILAFLLVVSLLQTARKIGAEQAILLGQATGKPAELVAMGTTKRDRTRSRASHGGGELEA